VSVAVKVTAWPDIDGFSDELMRKVATAALTVWATGLEVPGGYVPSPGYVTVIECTPVASEEVVHRATPPVSVTELQLEIAAPLSLKVTVPEGVPALPVRVAVKVTVWPDIEGFSDELMRKLATAALTVWLTVLDVPGTYVASPEYVTVMECAPTAIDEVVHRATPAESVTELHPEIPVPLSLKVTVPEGAPALPVSVAIHVTAWPDIEGFSVEFMWNVAATPTLTVWVNVSDVPGR
jgi:hypothetical protein